MLKRWIRIAGLVLALVLTASVSVGASSQQTYDGLIYEVPAYHGATVVFSHTYADTLKGTVTIPDKVDDTSVYTIGSMAFMECQNITEIVLPAKLTNIGSHAFSGCSGLTAVELPSTTWFIRIEEGAFRNCTQLRTVTFPDNVIVNIEPTAFEGCDNVVFVCYEGSDAHQYATEHGIAVTLLEEPTTTTLSRGERLEKVEETIKENGVPLLAVIGIFIIAPIGVAVLAYVLYKTVPKKRE